MKGKLLKVNRQKCLPVRSGFSWRVGRSWRVFPLIVLDVRVSGSVSRATNIADPKETKRKEIIRNISPFSQFRQKILNYLNYQA